MTLKSAGADVTRMVTEFGELLEAIDARADGTSTEDADRIEHEGNELIVAVRRAIEDARAAAPKATPHAIPFMCGGDTK